MVTSAADELPPRSTGGFEMKPHRLMPALCVASALFALGCGSDSGGTSNNPPPAGDILVQNDLYNPSTLSVAPGTTVTWAWDSDGHDHTVTFDAEPAQTSGIKILRHVSTHLRVRGHLRVPLPGPSHDHEGYHHGHGGFRGWRDRWGWRRWWWRRRWGWRIPLHDHPTLVAMDLSPPCAAARRRCLSRAIIPAWPCRPGASSASPA